MPMSEQPDAGWWEFGGSGDSLRLDGDDSEAVRFDPAQHSNNFTVMCEFSADDIVSVSAIISKWNSLIGKRCWLIYKNGDDVYIVVSKSGASGGDLTGLALLGCVTAGEKIRIVLRYKYVADGSSIMRIDSNRDSDITGLNYAEMNTSVGPVYSSTSADVQIADSDQGVDYWFEGKIYWISYHNRYLDDWEVDAIVDGTMRPQSFLEEDDWYEDFHDSVASTNDSEFPLDGSVGFTVEGTPTHGGTSVSTVWNERGTVHSIPEEVFENNIILAEFRSSSSPRASSLMKGLVTSLRVRRR